jgi:hypothetical protein
MTPGCCTLEHVAQLLSPENMNRRQRFMQRKETIIQEYQRAPGDTGSPEVQSKQTLLKHQAVHQHNAVVAMWWKWLGNCSAHLPCVWSDSNKRLSGLRAGAVQRLARAGWPCSPAVAAALWFRRCFCAGLKLLHSPHATQRQCRECSVPKLFAALQLRY